MENGRRDLFFFLFLGLVTGAWLGFSGFAFRSLLIILSAALFAFFAFKRGLPVLAIFVAAFIVGIILLSFRLPAKEGENDYLGFVIETKSNYFILWSRGVRYYVYENATEREIGDILLIHGSGKAYETTVYESRFDFAEYLRSRGVYMSISAKSVVAKWRWPLRLRSYELNYLGHFPSETRALIDGLLFSHQDYQQAFVEEASALGCLYFLSASGILYSTFCHLLERLLSLKLSESKSRFWTLVVASLFLPFNVSKAGLWRVFLSRLLAYVEYRRAVKAPKVYLLSLSGLLLLCANRFNALNAGFLMGYGLGFTMSLSQSLLARYKGKKGKAVGRILLFAFIFPSLAENGGLHLLSLVYSLILTPFSIGFGIIAFFGFWALPPVRLLVGYGQVIVSLVGFLSKIDLVVPLGGMGELFVYVFYYLYLAALYFWDVGLTFLRSAVFLSLTLLVALNAVPFGNALSQEIDFVNVGQGDCILIRDGFTSVMIDTGGNTGFDLAQEVDIPFLRKRKIYDLDCLIATHGDYDHIGAGKSLRDHFAVRKYVDDRSSFPLTIGSLRFENYNTYDLTSENEQSLVLSLDFMGKKWMFAGDAPISVENRILIDHPGLDCDILKVGHHGSETSSSYAWIRTLTPEVAIVSVGKRNPYGHPDEETLERFERCGVKVRRTDVEGTITYRCYLGKKLMKV